MTTERSIADANGPEKIIGAGIHTIMSGGRRISQTRTCKYADDTERILDVAALHYKYLKNSREKKKREILPGKHAF